MVGALGCCAVLALGVAASISTQGADVSEAQQDVMRNCPEAGKWAIAVWDGPDGTDTGQALAACGETIVATAYYINPEAQGWERWLAGRPELSRDSSLPKPREVGGKLDLPLSKIEAGHVALGGIENHARKIVVPVDER
jgi:hypothetical protein